MRLSIAGIVSEVRGMEDDALAEQVAARYRAFITEEEPVVTAYVHVRQPVMGTVPDADDPVVTVKRTDGELYDIRRLDNPFEATLDLSAGSASVEMNDNLYCFDSFLRILYSILLAHSDGLLLHSAAVVSQERAVLAVGVSEAGKTTFCSQGFPTVLSDELVAIRRSGGRYTAYSTPFWGEFVAGDVRAQADVGALYLLRKGPAHAVTPAPVASSVFEVLGCVFFFGPPELHGHVLDLTAGLVEEHLAGQFHFTPTTDVVAFLDKEVQQHVA